MPGLQRLEQEMLSDAMTTLRRDCIKAAGQEAGGVGVGGGGGRYQHVVMELAAQIRALTDPKILSSAHIGSIKSPMTAELRGLLAHFPAVRFCLSICGFKVVSGHIERVAVTFDIFRNRMIATLIEGYASSRTEADVPGSSPAPEPEPRHGMETGVPAGAGEEAEEAAAAAAEAAAAAAKARAAAAAASAAAAAAAAEEAEAAASAEVEAARTARAKADEAKAAAAAAAAAGALPPSLAEGARQQGQGGAGSDGAGELDVQQLRTQLAAEVELRRGVEARLREAEQAMRAAQEMAAKAEKDRDAYRQCECCG
jgi:hypothetical protein